MKNPDRSSVALLAHLLRDTPSTQTCLAAAEMLEHFNKQPYDADLAAKASIANAQLELAKIEFHRSLAADKAKRKYQLILCIALGVVAGVFASISIPSAHSETNPRTQTSEPAHTTPEPATNSPTNGNQQFLRLI